jgi:hypothetical protein
MKSVDTIARVRRAFHLQGWSLKRISRELHLSRNTIRKILRSDETSFSYERERQPKPKIGPWQDQLDALLGGNHGKPERERLTLIRIYEELHALGYEGGYDAIPAVLHAITWGSPRSSRSILSASSQPRTVSVFASAKLMGTSMARNTYILSQIVQS